VAPVRAVPAVRMDPPADWLLQRPARV